FGGEHPGFGPTAPGIHYLEYIRAISYCLRARFRQETVLLDKRQGTKICVRVSDVAFFNSRSFTRLPRWDVYAPAIRVSEKPGVPPVEAAREDSATRASPRAYHAHIPDPGAGSNIYRGGRARHIRNQSE
ncbi:hypothetical protein QP196_10565, partial [Streptococcus agalactiae]